MIVDTLHSADRYVTLHPLFRRAIDFLRTPGIASLVDGRYELEEGRMVALAVRKQGKPVGEAVLEAHVRDIDVHCVLEGTESIGWKSVGSCVNVKTPYDEATDCVLYDDNPEIWVPVPAGSFAIFFSGDAHATMVSPGLVHKVILKIREQMESS